METSRILNFWNRRRGGFGWGEEGRTVLIIVFWVGFDLCFERDL